MDLFHLFYYFTIYAFLGWCTEVIYCYYKTKTFINRGFLSGPFCPIYGIGVILIVFISTPILNALPKNNFIIYPVMFLYTTFLTSFLEYVTGFILEKLFNTTWWDYSDRKFNLKGRICLKFSILWGIGSFGVLLILHPFVKMLIDIIPRNIGVYILYLVGLYFIIDFVFTLKTLINFTSILNQIYNISTTLKDNVKISYAEIKSEASRRKDELAARIKLPKSFRIPINKYKFSLAFKKYTLIPRIKISNGIKNGFKRFPKISIITKQKLIIQRQIYDKMYLWE